MEKGFISGFLHLIFLLATCGRSFAVTPSGTVGVGVHFTQHPRSITALPGSPVVLNCHTNIDVDRIRWQHNWKWISGVGDPDIRAEKGRLVIRVANDPATYSQQIGEYRCVAWVDPIAVSSHPAILTVAHILPFASLPNSTVEALEGSSVSISCPPPVSFPPAEIVFFKDGVALRSSGDSVVLLPGGRLHLSDVSTATSGVYSCQASNTLLNRTLPAPFHTTLHVRVPGFDAPSVEPVLITAPQPVYSARVGSDLRIECVVSGWPVPVVRWRRTLHSQWSVRYVQLASSLWIRNLQPSDQDVFLCQASNSLGAVTAKTRVQLLEPPSVSTPFVDMTVSEGNSVHLDCDVSGFPPPAIQWTLKGLPLLTNHSSAGSGSSSARVVLLGGDEVMLSSPSSLSLPPLRRDVITQNGGRRLVISAITLGQAGYYQCFGHNQLGDNSTGVLVKVNPKAKRSKSSRGSDSSQPSPVHRHDRKYNTQQSGANAMSTDRVKRLELPVPSAPKLHQMSDVSVMLTWSLNYPGHETPPRPVVSVPVAGNGDYSHADSSYDYDEENTTKDPFKVQFFKIQFRQMPARTFRNAQWQTIKDNIGADRRSFLVAGLHLRSRYKFRVLSVYNNNDNRHGPNSARIKMRRIRPRERLRLAPKLLSAQSISAHSVRLEWQYDTSASSSAAADGGTSEHISIRGFFVHYQNALSAEEYHALLVEPGSVTNYTVTDLLPAVSYEFMLQALSSRGGGSPLSSPVRTRTLEIQHPHPPSGVSLITASSHPSAALTTLAPAVVRTRQISVARTRLYKTVGGLLAALFVGAALFVLIVLYCRGRHKMFVDSADRKHNEAGQHIRLQPAPFTDCPPTDESLQQHVPYTETDRVAIATGNGLIDTAQYRHAKLKTYDTQQSHVSRPVAIPTPPLYHLQTNTLPSLATLRQQQQQKQPVSTDLPPGGGYFIRSPMSGNDPAMKYGEYNGCMYRSAQIDRAPSSGDLYKQPQPASVTEGVCSSNSSLSSRPISIDANGNRRKRLYRRDSMEAQRNRMKTRFRS